MIKLNFDKNSQKTQHICRAVRDGENVLYSCPKCDYKMIENLETGHIRIENDDPRIQHSGSYIPHHYISVFDNQN